MRVSSISVWQACDKNSYVSECQSYFGSSLFHNDFIKGGRRRAHEVVRGSWTLVDGLAEAVWVPNQMGPVVGQSDKTDQPSTGSLFHWFLDQKRLFFIFINFFAFVVSRTEEAYYILAHISFVKLSFGTKLNE